MASQSIVVAVAILLASAASTAAQDIDPQKIRQPSSFTSLTGDAESIAQGRTLFEDTSLSTNGLACASCHADFGAFNDTFRAPYPHTVAMAKNRAGLDPVTAAEMVQLCMVVPMASETLAWDDTRLAALTTYVEHLQGEFAQK